MSVAASRKVARTANKRDAQTCDSTRANVHKILPFELFLREIWPHDRAKNYMRLTGAKSRATQYRLSGERDPLYQEVVAFLRSEHGFDLLRHVMGDAAPKWWRGVRKARSIGDLRRQQAELHRRLAQVEMALD